MKGFRVYLEDKNPEGKQCQHMILKDPRPLNFSYKTVVSHTVDSANSCFSSSMHLEVRCANELSSSLTKLCVWVP